MSAPTQELGEKWYEASIQLGLTSSWINISKNMYNRLGEVGQQYFKDQATMRIGKPAEFFLDGSNMNRIYLANRGDMEDTLFHRIMLVHGIKIPVAYPILEETFRNMVDPGPQPSIGYPVAPVNGQMPAPVLGFIPQYQSPRAGFSINSPAQMGFPVASPTNANRMQPNYLVNTNASNLVNEQATHRAPQNLPEGPRTREEQLALYNGMRSKQGTTAPKRNRKGPVTKSDQPKRTKTSTPSTGKTTRAANTLSGVGRGVHANPNLHVPTMPQVYNSYAVPNGFAHENIGSQMPLPASNDFGPQNAGLQTPLSVLNRPLPPPQRQRQGNTIQAPTAAENGLEQANDSNQQSSAVGPDVPNKSKTSTWTRPSSSPRRMRMKTRRREFLISENW